MSAQAKERNFLLSLECPAENIDDTELAHLIVKDFLPRRRAVASRQLKIYFHQLSSHPLMRSLYIKKIKQLIQLEKEMVKKV